MTQEKTTERPAAWNPFKEPPYAGWAPYCLVCSTMMRMKKTSFGWQCRACDNPIDEDGKHYHGRK